MIKHVLANLKIEMCIVICIEDLPQITKEDIINLLLKYNVKANKDSVIINESIRKKIINERGIYKVEYIDPNHEITITITYIHKKEYFHLIEN